MNRQDLIVQQPPTSPHLVLLLDGIGPNGLDLVPLREAQGKVTASSMSS